MQCAKCSGTLKTLDAEGTTLDQCGNCGGIWFDHRELRAVLSCGQAGGIDVDESHFPECLNATRGSCPRCQVALHTAESLAVDGLHYDECSSCKGIWLDRGELARFANPESSAVVGFFSKDI